MRAAIVKEFGRQKPRAIVLDDNKQSRVMTARKLKSRGFEVAQLATVPEFRQSWKPGMFDVIIADWDLSHLQADSGDHVLEEVREKDWDVPFVLVSGKLHEDSKRSAVLARLLESGSARFVKRGHDGIRKACDEAEDLIERRDQALLKIILSMREAALANDSIPTTTGSRPVQEVLAETVAKPSTSKDYGRPVARALSTKQQQKN